MNGVDRDKMIEETHDAATTLKAVILGVPGTEDKGLVGKVSEACEEMSSLRKSHNKLKVTVHLLIGLLVGSGVITGASIGINQLVNGG